MGVEKKRGVGGLGEKRDGVGGMGLRREEAWGEGLNSMVPWPCYASRHKDQVDYN